MRKKIRALVAGSVLLVVACWSASCWVNHQLNTRTQEAVYQECNKIWSNRGLVTDGHVQNSIGSIENAFANRARGVEIDQYYDADLKKFVVSHDLPYNMKDGKLLTLEEVFDATEGPDRYFWLDFKNLRQLTGRDARDAVERLEQISRVGDLKERIYVEDEDPVRLAHLGRAGFRTIYDPHPIADRLPASVVLINIYKMVYYFGGYSVFALNYQRHGDPIYIGANKEALANVPLFIYHVPDDPDLVDALIHDPAVRVILNENHSINNFYLSGCE